ncbi:phosphoglucomutase/phosphomannomutase family protein [Artemisia annua]|uniref:Phosphoglucomutase/phosphomannomutase family protein n=1 Tax=Artemisia annua TaxID=35608 RepID=A0A2U1KMD4_ARTAN|nr:phosphoglucomutase/phosphomannomutase family protein [Artemisia annua]
MTNVHVSGLFFGNSGHRFYNWNRKFYTRYDYENVDAGAAKELMAHLVKLQASLSDVKTTIKGIRSDVANVFRLSRTGSEGATIRLYIEQHEKDSSKTGRDSQDALAPLVEVALKL